MRKQTQQGFTLIELVVVVMILGILAAVAAPKLLGTSSTATDNGLKESLGVVRDAIERYTAEKGGALPGVTVATAAGFRNDLAPYIRVFPKSPTASGAAAIDVRIVTAAGVMTGSGTEGWAYNNKDGGFICNSNTDTKSDPSIKYDAL